MFSYAIAKDQDNEKTYLVGTCNEDMDNYCLENDLEIIARPDYVEPAMLAHHFIWVSEGKKPPILEISRPYKY